MIIKKIEKKDMINVCTWLKTLPKLGIQICETRGKVWIESSTTDEVLSEEYDQLYGFESDGLTRVRKGKDVALMDIHGNLITDWYGWIYPLDSRGLRGVHKGEKGRFWLKIENE